MSELKKLGVSIFNDLPPEAMSAAINSWGRLVISTSEKILLADGGWCCRSIDGTFLRGHPRYHESGWYATDWQNSAVYRRDYDKIRESQQDNRPAAEPRRRSPDDRPEDVIGRCWVNCRVYFLPHEYLDYNRSYRGIFWGSGIAERDSIASFDEGRVSWQECEPPQAIKDFIAKRDAEDPARTKGLDTSMDIAPGKFLYFDEPIPECDRHIIEPEVSAPDHSKIRTLKTEICRGVLRPDELLAMVDAGQWHELRRAIDSDSELDLWAAREWIDRIDEIIGGQI